MKHLNPKSQNLNVLLSIPCGIIVFLLASCSGSNSERSLLNHVPSSNAVLAVNWKTVGRDPDLRKISKGADVEKLFAQIGLESETVTEFAVFGNNGSAQASNGIVAKGSFNSNDIIRELIGRGWAKQEFEGRQLYVNPKGGSWVTTLDKNVLVLGTEAGVKDAIGARTKPENRFTANPAYKVLSSHFEGKQYPILVMVALPQASQDMANAVVQLTSTALDLAGVSPLGDLLNKIGYAQALGCAISHKDESFPVAVSAVMKDEDSAKFVSGALGVLRSLGGMVSKNYASQRDADAARAIQTMSIERRREVVSVRMTMSRRDLGAMNR